VVNNTAANALLNALLTNASTGMMTNTGTLTNTGLTNSALSTLFGLGSMVGTPTTASGIGPVSTNIPGQGTGVNNGFGNPLGFNNGLGFVAAGSTLGSLLGQNNTVPTALNTGINSTGVGTTFGNAATTGFNQLVL
jgi:hypothetical protein